MQKKDLSIIIPVYNEQARLKQTITRLLKYLKANKFDPEIIFVNDGSTDNTEYILRLYKKQVRKIEVMPNRGKGRAIREGILAAEGEYILFMDADLATPLFEIENIFAKRHFADIVIGSRTNALSKTKRTWFRKIAGRTYHTISHFILPLDIEDSQCGFKLFSNQAAKVIFSKTKIDRWSFDAEVLILAKKMGFSLLELPVSWEEKTGSKVRFFRDTFIMVRDLLRIRRNLLSDQYNLEENFTKVFPKESDAIEI